MTVHRHVLKAAAIAAGITLALSACSGSDSGSDAKTEQGFPETIQLAGVPGRELRRPEGQLRPADQAAGEGDRLEGRVRAGLRLRRRGRGHDRRQRRPGVLRPVRLRGRRHQRRQDHPARRGHRGEGRRARLPVLRHRQGGQRRHQRAAGLRGQEGVLRRPGLDLGLPLPDGGSHRGGRDQVGLGGRHLRGA